MPLNRHTDAWHDANKARAAAVIAFCESPTAESHDAMERVCAAPQGSFFNAPPHAGVATSGQPEPSGLADAPFLGALGG